MWADPETWVAASFILFIAVILYYRAPARVAKALDSRSATIARELEEARKLRQEAEAVLADYRQRSANAEAEAKAILAMAEREAAAYVKEARTSFDEMLARRMNLAEQKIRQEEEKARKEIRTQAAELAIAAAEQLIERKVTGKMAEDMITSSIDRIKKRLH